MCLSERVWLRLTAIYIKRKGFQIWQGTHTKMLMHVAMEILKGHNIRPENPRHITEQRKGMEIMGIKYALEMYRNHSHLYPFYSRSIIQSRNLTK